MLVYIYMSFDKLKRKIIGFVSGVLVSSIFFSRNIYDSIHLRENMMHIKFVPGDDITQNIVDHINAAKKSIYIQAYGWSSNNILNSVKSAAAREVKIFIILDKSNVGKYRNKSQSYFMQDLLKLGVNILIDSRSIAHNKVMIIDESIVITGSFNFTESANRRNVENVIFLYSKDAANRYLNNWHNREKCSTPLHKLINNNY